MEHYFVITGKTRDENGAVHKTYGLALWENGRIRRRIEDVSTNKRCVKLMAGCMNRHRVAAVHFEGVVEDMLVCRALYTSKKKESFVTTVWYKHIAAIF